MHNAPLLIVVQATMSKKRENERVRERREGEERSQTSSVGPVCWDCGFQTATHLSVTSN